jgi:hypothetical protein
MKQAGPAGFVARFVSCIALFGSSVLPSRELHDAREAKGDQPPQNARMKEKASPECWLSKG